ncbi:MAG TPA: transposase [Chitinophagaceae bacterium]|jgi:REP element-mobilizing transposase RayT
MSYIKESITPEQAYCLTFNVVERVDIFVRPVFKQIIVESLNYFAAKKGLIIYGWCLMTNHLHVLVQANGDFESLIGEFKKFTAKIILANIETGPEMRRNWISKKLKEIGQVWESEINPIHFDLENPTMLHEHLHLIHQNPVRNKIVSKAEDYIHSSARDYVGIKGLVNIYIQEERSESKFILRHISSYSRIPKIN